MHWTDLPPDIATVLRSIKPCGITRAVNLFIQSDGTFLASMQRPDNASAYKTVINDDPVVALILCLGPDYGGSWAEHLEPPEKVQANVPVDDDEDDYMSVV